MSFQFAPERTADITFPDWEKIAKCPECGHIAPNIQGITENLYSANHYAARHIPRYLVFTCANDDCPRCDIDFYVYLSVAVMASNAKRE